MASWKQQGLIDAPVEEVWGLLGDISRYPEWNPVTIEVTGVPTEVQKGSSFEMKGRGPLGLKPTTTFKVEELDDLREVKLRCQTSGWYSHWVLTEAQDQTFTEVEMGIEPIAGLEGRLSGAIHTKGNLRRAAEDSLDNLKRALGRESAQK
jgi:uncharacterized protein YndB with AHSA1/START domain